MTDWIPKFSDVRTLQDLAKVLAFPMLMASWILQSGMQLSVPDSGYMLQVSETWPRWVQIVVFLIIFIGKCLWAAIWGGTIYMALVFLTVYAKAEWLLIAAMLLLAFGIFGLAGGMQSVKVIGLHTLWFYTAIVYAFFLHGANKEFSL